jgi:hypothetical protein
MGSDDEVVLHGGNTNVVVRVGATVRRTSGAWTPTIHALLRHLESEGFDAAPRALGLDDRGREMLSYIEGTAVHYPMPSYVWADSTLTDVGRLLRRYHDLTVDFSVPEPEWRPYAPSSSTHEVICHNDWGPYNAIFRDDRLVAMVDWDFAQPGTRLADLAYAAYTWVPIQRPEDYAWQGASDTAGQGRRLRLLCDAYGLEDRSGVLPALEDRLTRLADWVETLASGRNAALTQLFEHYGICQAR